MVNSKYLLTCPITVIDPGDLALYTEMKEGILEPQTDYASRPLRDHLKSTDKYFCPLYIYISYSLSQRALRKQIKCFCQYLRMPQRLKGCAPPSAYLKDPSSFLTFQTLSSNLLKRYDLISRIENSLNIANL